MNEVDVNRLVDMVKEVFPELDRNVIEVLLEENNYDLEKSINAGLTYQRIEEIEYSNSAHSTQAIEFKDVRESLHEKSTRISDYTMNSAPFSDSMEDKNSRYLASNSSDEGIVLPYRGSAIELPPNFLIQPRCRLTSYQIYKDRIEFSVLYKRNQEKLGFSIDVSDGLITILQIPKKQEVEYLATISGVLQNDIILGVNDYYFSPYVDKDDIITILDCSKPLTKIHFLRVPDRASLHSSSFHPYVTYVRQQKVLDTQQAFLVTLALTALKRKAITWNSYNIPKLYYSYMDHSIKNSPSLTRRQSKALNLTMNANLDNTVEMIRPALMARILRFEYSSTDNNHILVVIWVLDVETGTEWIMKCKYADFFELHQHVCLLRPTLESLEFPNNPYVKTTSSNHNNNTHNNKSYRNNDEIMEAASEEIIPILQKFLIHLIKITAYHTFLPSILQIQLLLLQFLEIPKHTQQITSIKITASSMVRVFIHNVLLLNSLENSINSFVDTYLSHSVDDLDEEWTIEKAESALLELRRYMDAMHNFLLQYFYQDCSDICQALCSPTYSTSSSRSSINNALVLSPTTTLTSIKVGDESYKEHEYDAISQAIRKQVEADIYMKCIDRVKFIINHALQNTTTVYKEKILQISSFPLSIFEIESDFLSNESWLAIIKRFKEFREFSLPSDKIDSLVSSFKYLSLVYQHEHHLKDVSALGADEMVPCFIYVFAKAFLPDLIFLNFELQLFNDPNNSLSERGYCLATLEAAISHLMEFDVNHPHLFPK